MLRSARQQQHHQLRNVGEYNIGLDGAADWQLKLHTRTEECVMQTLLDCCQCWDQDEFWIGMVLGLGLFVSPLDR